MFLYFIPTYLNIFNYIKNNFVWLGHKPINKAIYEMWIACLYKLTQDERNQLILMREEVILSFQKFLQIPDIVTAIKAGDKYSVTKRMNEIEKMVGGILGDK